MKSIFLLFFLFFFFLFKCISACVTPKRPGDSAIGLCMKKAGIIMSETRDKLGRFD